MDGRRSIAGRGTARLTADLAWGFRGIGDLDGDGRDDVLLRHEDGRWRYHPMNGRGPSAGGGEVDITRTAAWQFRGLGDLDGDGRDDILLRHEDGRWHYYPMDGARVAAGSGPASRLTTNLDWRYVGIGDLNGDGKGDLVLRHKKGRWRYYPMNGRHVLANSGLVNLTTDGKWRFAGMGDLNGDGRDDVLLRHVDGRWHYHPLDGRRRIAAEAGAADLATDSAWRFAGIGDLNGDGRDDVLLRHEDGRWRYYPMDGRAVGEGAGEATMTRNRNWSIPSTKLPVDGKCGYDEANMCLAGNLNDIDDTVTEFRWDCDGIHGGRTAMCSLLKPIDGRCGGELNRCLTGSFNDVEDTDTDYLWNCDSPNDGKVAMCSLTKTVVCPNGAAASDNPLLCRRGSAEFMISGIDRLPLDRVQLTNEQIQRHFAIVEVDSAHAEPVGEVACESYVTASEGCRPHANRTGATRHPEGDEETRTGLIPFTQILDLSRGHGSLEWRDGQLDAIRDLRILSVSLSPNGHYLGDADKPRLQIQAAGNSGSNYSWFLDGSIPHRLRDLLTRAITANKLLLVAGMDRDANDNYIRHPDSSSCRDVDYGCLWTKYSFQFPNTIGTMGGTSGSTPNIAASLAAILSIFPDTLHQDLAKLARACAKKTGEGIDGPDGLLATSGGFGVADFSCMDEITAASAELAANETVVLDIDGREVAVSPRSITVTEPES